MSFDIFKDPVLIMFGIMAVAVVVMRLILMGFALSRWVF